jgi:hypothetical protein
VATSLSVIGCICSERGRRGSCERVGERERAANDDDEPSKFDANVSNVDVADDDDDVGDANVEGGDDAVVDVGDGDADDEDAKPIGTSDGSSTDDGGEPSRGCTLSADGEPIAEPLRLASMPGRGDVGDLRAPSSSMPGDSDRVDASLASSD